MTIKKVNSHFTYLKNHNLIFLLTQNKLYVELCILCILDLKKQQF